MIELALGVTYTDGRTEQVKVGPRTQVAFEREHDVSFAALADGPPRLSWLYWLVHHALVAEGRCALDFDAWLANVGSLETDEVTDTAPLAGPVPPISSVA